MTGDLDSATLCEAFQRTAATNHGPALVNAQTGSTIYDQGEFFSTVLDLTAIGRIRLVADFSGTGQACAVEAYMVTADSIG